MYFKNSPKIKYNFPNISDVTMVDIFKRTRFLFDDNFTHRTYQWYSLKSGETIDSVALKFYGSPDWSWLIMLFNDIVNPFFENYENLNDEREFMTKQASSNDDYFYLQRDGGDDNQDFKAGDIIVLASSSETETSLRGGVSYNSPTAITDTATRAAVPIVEWNSAFREATVRGKFSSRFSDGDKFCVLEKGTQLGDHARAVKWGTIKKIVKDPDRIVDFIKNDTGRSVSPLWKHQSNSMAERLSPIDMKAGNNPSYGDTLLGGVLGMDGGAGSTYANEYSAIIKRERSITDQPLSRIKVLDDAYKYQALNLLNRSYKKSVGDVTSTISSSKSSSSPRTRGSY